MLNTDSSSSFVSHEPCPSCKSQDNLARYSDGHAYCFGCAYREDGKGSSPSLPSPERKTDLSLLDVKFMALSARGIDEETCRKFGYGVGSMSGQPVQVALYRIGSFTVSAQKIRTRAKTFSILGDGRNLSLFGQHLWDSSGRMVVVSEGEIDALSISQIQGNKWPVVSVSHGAAGATKSIKNSLEWLEGFDTVVFMFDADEPGQKAAVACSLLMSPGKAKIAALPLKDANEMLLAGRGKEVVSAIWGAKTYRPDGLVAGEEMWDLVIAEDNKESVEYPWMGLNEKTYGIRSGEVVTVCSGTGQGKSLVCREWQHWLLGKGFKVGIIALEESVCQSAQALIGINLECPPHKWRDMNVTEEQKRKSFDETVGSGRCVLYDHWGSLDSENLLSRVRYMVRGMGCTHLFIDHLSIVISGLGDGDERRMIDNLMTKLRSLVEELGIALFIVSHLRRPEGRAHEEGSVVSLSHLRGSASIAHLSDIVLALERNQQDDENSNISTVRVLKNRYTGETGVACRVQYSSDTGRLTELIGPPNTEEETPF